MFLLLFFLPFSQPLVPRETITAWMNAIGLVITALPVRKKINSPMNGFMSNEFIVTDSHVPPF